MALRFSALGDVAMTVPVIYSVAKEYPDTEIFVATRPFFARLFINAPENVKVLPFDLAKEYKGFGGVLKIARELAALRPDAVADLHNIGRSWVITALLALKGCPTATVDKARRSRKKVMSGGAPQQPYIERYFEVFSRLGLPAEPDFTSVFSTLPEPPVPVMHPAVGIAPFARYATKTYPPEMMKEVAETLAEKGVHIYLFGGRGADAETLSQWENEGIASVAGKFPIEKELALMANLDIMISMDSANQHLASLVGTPVISIWGGTTPACGFLGYRQDQSNALSLGLPCQPCSIAGTPTCPKGDLECMLKLSPTVIVGKVTELLHKRNL